MKSKSIGILIFFYLPNKSKMNCIQTSQFLQTCTDIIHPFIIVVGAPISKSKTSLLLWWYQKRSRLRSFNKVSPFRESVIFFTPSSLSWSHLQRKNQGSFSKSKRICTRRSWDWLDVNKPIFLKLHWCVSPLHPKSYNIYYYI